MLHIFRQTSFGNVMTGHFDTRIASFLCVVVVLSFVVCVDRYFHNDQSCFIRAHSNNKIAMHVNLTMQIKNAAQLFEYIILA